MRPFQYASATRVEEAIGLLTAERPGHTRPLAGGTDLLPLMKADVEEPARLVNIKALAGLEGVSYDPARGLELGALTRLADLELDAMVRRHCPMLAQAAAVAATPQLRNMATLGGNLLQRPRCWYYRSAHVRCWLKGGEGCPVRYGESRLGAIIGGEPCYAVHPSDVAPVLVALDAEVRTRGPRGERTIGAEAFFQPPTEERRTETILEPDELVLSVRVPPLPEGARGTYLKAMDRKTWAFALAGVAAVVRRTNGRIDHARLVLSGVAPVPWRSEMAERVLMGAVPGEETFARAADTALSIAEPLRDNRYKVPLTRVLIIRALRELSAG